MDRVYAVYPRTRIGLCKDRYEFNGAKGWRPIQRLCFWLLGKIGAYSETTVKTESLTLSAGNLSVALLFKHRREVERLMYEPARVIMGAEDWSELMGDAVLSSVVRFNAPVDFRQGDRPRVIGLDVTIVPWMRGLVVLPKEVA